MSVWLWALFIGFLIAAAWVDLRWFHPSGRRVLGVQPALAATAGWTGLALAFNVLVYFIYEHHWLDKGTELGGHEAVVQFLTAYLTERSLSLDNLFVIAVIFNQFQVPLAQQLRVLNWAIVGALVLRAMIIVSAVALIDDFAWVRFIFAGMLLITAARLLFSRPHRFNWRRAAAVRGLRKRVRILSHCEGDRFTVQRGERRWITPLLVALMAMEWSNLVFAIDAIPAAIAVTQDPFLVFTSNAFALMGLRSLYFTLLGTIEKFRFLKVSLVAILVWVGVKILLQPHVEMPAELTLSVVLIALSGGMLASIVWPSTERSPWVPPIPPELATVAEVTWATARRLIVLVIGVGVVLIGVAMIVLPGPAVIVIPLGLAILATEFVWAQRLLRRARKSTKGLIQKMNEKRRGWMGRHDARRGTPPTPPSGPAMTGTQINPPHRD